MKHEKLPPTTTEQELEAVTASLLFTIELLTDLMAQMESCRSRGNEIPTDLRDQCRRIARICPVLGGSLDRYASLLAELCEPGRLPADLRACADPTVPDEKRVEALERMALPIIDGVSRRLRLSDRGDFYRSLRMEAPHLTTRGALKRSILSCLVVIAKEVCNSLTLGECLAGGNAMLRHKVDRALPKEVIGPWCHTAAGPVEELTSEHQDHGPSPETIAELELLRFAPGLTPKERAVVQAAVEIRSGIPREIAYHTGMSPELVRVHWCNACRKLRGNQP